MDETATLQESRFLQLVHAMDGKGGPARQETGKPAPGINTPPRQALAELNARLLSLTTMKAQERGFAFEKFLSDLFGLYNLDRVALSGLLASKSTAVSNCRPKPFCSKQNGRMPRPARQIC